MKNKDVFDIFDKTRGYMDYATFTELISYSLLLKKLEIAKPEFYQDNFSTTYLSRLYGDLIHESDLCKYVNTIEEVYGLTLGTLSIPLSEILNKFSIEKDKRVLLDIFRAVSELDFENEEEIAVAFDSFLESVVKQRGNGYINYSLNPYLAKLEARLLDVQENNSVYDPFCGAGTSIISASKSKTKLHVRDLNINIIAIVTINMILHDCNIAEVNCGDSIFSEPSKYDRIISEPPFNAKYATDGRDERILKKVFISKDTMDLETVLNNLNDNGKAVVLVPAGILFKGGRVSKFREFILEENLLESVISIPSGVCYGTALNTALLIFNKNKDFDGIIMVDSSQLWDKENVRDYTLTNETIDEIYDVVKNKKIVNGISSIVGKGEIYENETNITPTSYVDPYTISNIKVADISKLINIQAEYEKLFYDVCNRLNEFRNK